MLYLYIYHKSYQKVLQLCGNRTAGAESSFFFSLSSLVTSPANHDTFFFLFKLTRDEPTCMSQHRANYFELLVISLVFDTTVKLQHLYISRERYKTVFCTREVLQVCCRELSASTCHVLSCCRCSYLRFEPDVQY